DPQAPIKAACMVGSQALLLKAWRMPLYWLCYRHNNSPLRRHQACAFPHLCQATSFDFAGLDQGEFTEGHELKGKIAEQMIGRRLSQAEAKRLLAKLE